MSPTWTSATRRRPTPAPRLSGCRPYSPPKPAAPVDLRLDGNEGPTPPAELWQALGRDTSELIRRYPTAANLEQLLAARFGVAREQVLVTAGADDALYRTCLAVLGPGREAILPVPTFEMLPRYAQLAGAEVITVPWPEGDYPTGLVCERISPETALIAIVSPNNPTGAVATRPDLHELSAAAPQALLLVDLAYCEFAEQDLTEVALALPNALVVRTFSKAWGLAGLRVGYALGPAEFIGWLRTTGNPYAVSGPSAAVAAAWLERGAATVEAFIRRVRRERSELVRLLRTLGAVPLPSQANFVLARFADPLGVQAALAARGIAVRAFPDRPELVDCLRITCPGGPESFERLSIALKRCLTRTTPVGTAPAAVAWTGPAEPEATEVAEPQSGGGDGVSVP